MQNLRNMPKKRWADLSLPQQIGVIVGGTIQIGLLAAGLWDLAHRSADEVRGDRRMWAGLMFINWLGPLAYFAYGRKNSPLRFCGCKGGRQAAGPSLPEETASLAGPTVV
jgi:hypothetical protein